MTDIKLTLHDIRGPVSVFRNSFPNLRYWLLERETINTEQPKEIVDLCLTSLDSYCKRMHYLSCLFVGMDDEKKQALIPFVHDIRGPLGTFKNYFELLKRHIGFLSDVETADPDSSLPKCDKAISVCENALDELLKYMINMEDTLRVHEVL